ncbi:MAG TPA: immunoglobulin-like domain-containing protein, partial [Haploplasma sp.]|nr:immunoglobulin-like domain-containing protein [Haploplasma sp.]
MKKVLGIMFTLLLAVTLVACKEDPKPPVGGLTDADYVAAAKTALSLGSEEQIKNVINDIDLPLKNGQGEAEVAVTWAVTTGTAIQVDGAKGKVTRPESGSDDAEVVLTATLKKGEATDTKAFNLVVLALVETDKFDTIALAIEHIEDENLGKGYIFTLKSVTVIGQQRDGYFISDGTHSLYVHGGTKQDVGKTGEFATELDIYYDAYQLIGGSSSFAGNTTNKTEAEIKAMVASTSKDVAFFQAEVPAQGTIANLADVKQDMNYMGFFKKDFYVYVDPKIKSDQHDLVLLDASEDAGTEKFIQVYYKSTDFEALKTLAKDGARKITIYANTQEIRDNLGNASPVSESGNMNVLRVVVLYYEVELTDADKAAVVEGDIKAEHALNPHFVKEGTELAILNHTDDTVDSIVWDFKDAQDTNNALIDLTNKKVVTVPETEKTVKLTYTITKGSVVVTGDINVIVGLPTVITEGYLAAINAAELTHYVTFEGNITAIKGEKYTDYFFVEGEERVQVYGLSQEQRDTVDAAIAA